MQGLAKILLYYNQDLNLNFINFQLPKTGGIHLYLASSVIWVFSIGYMNRNTGIHWIFKISTRWITNGGS